MGHGFLGDCYLCYLLIKVFNDQVLLLLPRHIHHSFAVTHHSEHSQELLSHLTG